MSDLDVSLRLRLINLMAGGSCEAIGDLRRVQVEAEKLNLTQASGGKISASVWVEQQKAQADAMKKAQSASEEYFASLDRKLARLGMMQMGFAEAVRTIEKLRKPLDEATDAAVEFEKRIRSIAKAGGLLGSQKEISESILAAAKAGNVSWQELAKGERQLVSLGGGDSLKQLGPVRAGLAQLIKASEADAGDLYNFMYHYMHLLKFTPRQALSAAEINYQQGKKGAFELKDVAEVMPNMIPLAKGLTTPQQVSTDFVALLQILRKETGSAGEAATRARQLMTKLDDPAYAKRIKKELDVDVYALRKEAKSKGENQLFVVLTAIAKKIRGDGGGRRQAQGKQAGTRT